LALLLKGAVDDFTRVECHGGRGGSRGHVRHAQRHADRGGAKPGHSATDINDARSWWMEWMLPDWLLPSLLVTIPVSLVAGCVVYSRLRSGDPT